MLCASILKIFYWPGARYDIALLVQALIMVAVQVVLLKVRFTELMAWVLRSSSSEADRQRIVAYVGGTRQSTSLERRKSIQKYRRGRKALEFLESTCPVTKSQVQLCWLS